jgi:hypothetical protein
MLMRHPAIVLFLALGAAACTPQSGETGEGPSGSGGQAAASGGSGPTSSTGGSTGTTTGGSGPAATGGAPGTGGAAPTASGGSPGSTGSGGGGGEGADPEDAGPAPGKDGAATGSGGSGPAPAPTGAAEPESLYSCTHLIGINATEEWFDAGFQSIVEDAKWQIVRVHSGFVDVWANPTSAFWNTKVSSPCAMNSDKPDRIIFVGLKFEWTDKKMWVDALTAVVKNLKAKFPSVKRIELSYYVRAPGNKPCGSAPPYRSTIHPSQDEATAEVVATDPVLLRAAPKLEVTACSDFSGNPPHFSSAGTKNVAKLVGDYYAGKK